MSPVGFTCDWSKFKTWPEDWEETLPEAAAQMAQSNKFLPNKGKSLENPTGPKDREREGEGQSEREGERER